MRIFWSLILVLIVAAGVIVYAHERERTQASRPALVAQDTVPPPSPALPRRPIVAEPEPEPAAPDEAPPPSETIEPAKPTEQPPPEPEELDAEVEADVEPSPAAEAEAVAEPPAPPQVVATGEEALRLADEFFRQAFAREEAAEAPRREETPSPSPQAAPVQQDPTPAPADEPAPAAPEQTAAATPAKPEPEKTAPEETLAVDDRFVLRGKGTKESPYRITWEQLASAYESYRPKEGRTEIPEHIRMLHDKHVKITGYMTLPLAAGEAKELLLMLNQWDGCCVGVPPSPYDSIEVKLTKPVDPSQLRFASRGSVSGVFKVDPYVVNNWLVGLYMMERAELELWM